jgi:PAS domain S-box-containing protein
VRLKESLTHSSSTIDKNSIGANKSNTVTTILDDGPITGAGLFEAAFNHAADAMMIVDEDNKIIAVNDALSSMLYCPKAVLIGKHCSEVFLCHGNAKMEGQCLYSNEAGNRPDTTQTQCGFIDRKGEKVTLCMIHANIPFPRHKDPYRVVVVLNSTAQRRRIGVTGKTIAAASHELLSPLNLIRGYATTVSELDQNLTSEERRRYLKGIEVNVTKAAQLIRNFLEMPRIESECLSLTTESTSLPEFLRHVVSETQRECVDHVISLQVPHNLAKASIDRKKLRRVIDNLLVNAIKYSPKGSDIIVSAREINIVEKDSRIGEERYVADVPCLLVSVKDSGVGIPEEDIELIFEKFYRVDNTITRAVAGAGIGLYLCKVIIEAHGGRLWATSELGAGSVLSFTLPL